MGCFPSKNANENSMTTGLLPPETATERNSQPMHSYEVSSSDDDEYTLAADRRNGSQHLNSIVKQGVQNLIDVPSLAYSLYGANSPYTYCEDYNSAIANVKIVDGILNVKLLPDIDKQESVESLLQRPVTINYVQLRKCGELLEEEVDRMKISGDSLIVAFK